MEGEAEGVGNRNEMYRVEKRWGGTWRETCRRGIG